MTEFRPAAKTAVPWVATKYDKFTLVQAGEYKHQKGSGRSACFELAANGMTIGEWTKKCAEAGFDSKFVVGSLIKLSGAKQPGWKFSDKDADGKTLDDIKKIRDADPAIIEKRAAKAKAAEEAKAAKKKAAEEAKAKRDAETKAKKEAAEKAAAEAKAKKAKEAEEAKAKKDAEAKAEAEAKAKATQSAPAADKGKAPAADAKGGKGKKAA